MLTPVVIIAATADDLEPLARFLDVMPVESGGAIVVVVRPCGGDETRVMSLVVHHTAIPVFPIEDGTRIAANQIHVAASGQELTLAGDVLRVAPVDRRQPGGYLVDRLLASIAAQQRRAIAVILSCVGNDGVRGLRELKASGGMALVQDPATARQDAMPRSAICAGVADVVVPPEAMPDLVLQYLQHGEMPAPGEPASPAGRPELEQLYDMLHEATGRDFRVYKLATAWRRITRRMRLKGIGDLRQYLALAGAEPEEVQALAADLVISVTSFFRDPEAWQAFEQVAVAPMVAGRPDGATLRIWIPACATGEEAYSVAMLVLEHAEAAQKRFDIRIFASDIQDDGLNIARAGIYPAASIAAIAPERVERFFDALDGAYQIKKSLRDLLIFTRHDLLDDPPLSRMDLLTCRNVLIYLEPAAQKRAIGLFHFALREGGCLFLGNSETADQPAGLFQPLSRVARLYCRVGPTRHDIISFPGAGLRAAAGRPAPLPGAAWSPARLGEIARRALLDRYAPPAVLVDATGRVLYFHGETGDYLRPPAGEPTLHLVAMAREGLVTKLRSALPEVLAAGGDGAFTGQVRHDAAGRPVTVRLMPLQAGASGPNMVLIAFEPQSSQTGGLRPQPAVTGEVSIDPAASAGNGPSTAGLEDELRLMRAELQGSIDQLERANEELKAANEEISSMNEELQSINDELEASKQELQSFNAELQSMNEQLHGKIGELEQVGNDLGNLLAGTDIATVFLDTQFRIKWFSPATRALLDLVSSDIGRPIRHFSPKFDDARLLSEAQAVLANLTPAEAEIRSDDGRWFLRRILPYRTQDDRIAGVVITFIDITERKLAHDALNEARIYAEAIIDTARHPLAVLDSDLCVRSANRAFFALFQTSADQIGQRPVFALCESDDEAAAMRALLQDVLPLDRKVLDTKIVLHRAGRRQVLLVDAHRLAWNGGREALLLLALEDITDQEHTARQHEMLIGELNHRVKNVLSTVHAIMSQTARRAGSLPEFELAFEGRLRALSGAHDLVLQRRWLGADIKQLVEQTLAPYRIEGADRIAVSGPSVMVRPQTGVSLAMILHELATNAAKYGALSGACGRLTIAWEVLEEATEKTVCLQWHEDGGPIVTKPSREGFGTKLIERTAQQDLEGLIQLCYLEQGLQLKLSFPWIEPNYTSHARD